MGRSFSGTTAHRSPTGAFTAAGTRFGPAVHCKRPSNLSRAARPSPRQVAACASGLSSSNSSSSSSSSIGFGDTAREAVTALKNAFSYFTGSSRNGLLAQNQLSRQDACTGDAGSTGSNPMSVKARPAFAALEDSYDADVTHTAMDTLCMVTYSEEEQEGLPAPSSSSSRSRGPGGLLTSAAISRAFAQLSSDGSEAAGVMETLCIVSYSDDEQ